MKKKKKKKKKKKNLNQMPTLNSISDCLQIYRGSVSVYVAKASPSTNTAVPIKQTNLSQESHFILGINWICFSDSETSIDNSSIEQGFGFSI